MKPSDYSVDNADTGRASHHPCYGGEGRPLSHSYRNGVCEDCEHICEHQDAEVIPTAGSPIEGLYCPECEMDLDEEKR